jgi:hypothetical protein
MLVHEFSVATRALILHEKDKAYYKKVKLLCDDLESKIPYVSSDMESEIKEVTKHLGVVTTLIKIYKAWVKKPEAGVYMKEKKRLEEFAFQDPILMLVLPTCILQDEVEMKFLNELRRSLEVATITEHADIDDRWRLISMPRLRVFFNEEEAASFQVRVISDSFADLLSQKIDDEAGVAILHAMFAIFICSYKSIVCSLAKVLEDALDVLHSVVDVTMYAGRSGKVQDAFQIQCVFV